MMADNKKFGNKGPSDDATSYVLDSSVGLIAMSVGMVGVAVLLLVYFAKRMGVSDVQPREQAGLNRNNTHRTVNRQPQLLQRPG